MRPILEKNIRVLNHKGQILENTDYRKAKKLLKEKKAVKVATTPFTIKLTISSA